MRVLLVHPRFPVTYWGFQYGLRIAGKRAALPPLGLITLAACLPSTWDLRLVDLNVRDLLPYELDWADAVFTGGMLIQSESALEVIRRARAAGRFVVVGGPAPTTTPELFEEADVIFRGEAEGRIEALVEAVKARRGGRLEPAEGDFPDVTTSPVPRFDLLELDRYASMSIQYSRGCPFRCEFCDVIEIFGRRPRVKTPEQVIAELSALRQRGYRGTLFIVDDNFIGNRRAARAMLPHLRDWQIEHRWPFELYTEASVDLSSDDELTRAMVDAGFASVFLGIETPSLEALRATKKHQNAKVDLGEAVAKLTRAGLEVMGGFIVGFDQDGPGIFEAQRSLIQSSPMPFAMVGLLMALPGTALFRRLAAEGRLRERAGGDQFARPNFAPAMDELLLLEGYADLVSELYELRRYYERCHRYLDTAGHAPGALDGSSELRVAARAVLRLGIAGRHRRLFWQLVGRGSGRGGRGLRWAAAHAIMGEHLIRYTAKHAVPRVRAAARELARSGVEWRPGRPRVSLPVLGGPVLADGRTTG